LPRSLAGDGVRDEHTLGRDHGPHLLEVRPVTRGKARLALVKDTFSPGSIFERGEAVPDEEDAPRVFSLIIWTADIHRARFDSSHIVRVVEYVPWKPAIVARPSMMNPEVEDPGESFAVYRLAAFEQSARTEIRRVKFRVDGRAKGGRGRGKFLITAVAISKVVGVEERGLHLGDIGRPGRKVKAGGRQIGAVTSARQWGVHGQVWVTAGAKYITRRGDLAFFLTTLDNVSHGIAGFGNIGSHNPLHVLAGGDQRCGADSGIHLGRGEGT